MVELEAKVMEQNKTNILYFSTFGMLSLYFKANCDQETMA